MQIEILPIDTLIPYARNSRTHSDEQVAQIAASIREFGFTNPVLIDAAGSGSARPLKRTCRLDRQRWADKYRLHIVSVLCIISVLIRFT